MKHKSCIFHYLIFVLIDFDRSILEAKALLYEKMTSEALEHDEHEHPVLSQSLVNFTQKAVDRIKESRSGEERESVKNQYDDYNVIEDEWTEFTDALGRTRRCLKSDLPSFIVRDEEMTRPQNPAGISLSKEAGEKLLEMKRDKWEQEAEEAAVKEKVHYQDVLYDGKITFTDISNSAFFIPFYFPKVSTS